MKKHPLMKFIVAAEDSKKALEADRRVDSLSAERISKLYNLDVNKKGRNITEEAHPDILAAFDSYDKLNGVLKNDNQKQDITINILLQKQTGALFSQKLASEARLINSLVKTASYLDHADPVLAMYCDKILVEFDNSLKKKAAAPAIAAGFIIPAMIVGLMYWQQHSSAANLGLLENVKRMGKEIDDIINDKAFITGRDYNESFRKTLISCKNNLSKILVLFRELKTKLTAHTFPENGEQLLATSKDIASQEIVSKFTEFKNLSTAMINYLENLKENIKDEDMKSMQVSNKGFLTDLIDRTKILSGGKGFIKDDIDDVSACIDPIIDSLNKTLEIMDQAQKKSQEVIRIGVAGVQAKEKAEKSIKVKDSSPSTESSPDDMITQKQKELAEMIKGK